MLLIPETHPKGLSSLLSEIQNRSLRFCELATLVRFPVAFSKHKKSPHERAFLYLVEAARITKYIPVFCPTGLHRFAPKFKIVPYDFVNSLRELNPIHPSNKKSPHERAFLCLVEAARIELASANPAPSVLHA